MTIDRCVVKTFLIIIRLHFLYSFQLQHFTEEQIQGEKFHIDCYKYDDENILYWVEFRQAFLLYDKDF